MRIRRSFSFACLVASVVAMSGCAQALNDTDTGAGDDTSDGPDTGAADASDGGHHSYIDSAPPSDTGGGQQGQDASPIGQDAGSGTDSATPHDAAVPDTSVPDTSVPDTSTGGGGTDCPNDAQHIAEALAASLDPSTPTCSTGSDCSSGLCCYGALLCIPQ